MKIRSVTTWTENLELTKPYRISYETINSVENVFVKIQLENGIYGIGSGCPAEFVTGENIDSCSAILKAKAESFLAKKNIEDIELICNSLKDGLSLIHI